MSHLGIVGVDRESSVLHEKTTFKQLFINYSKTRSKFPVKLTEPLTAILYITADKIHMEEYKHAIHVKEIIEGKAAFFLKNSLHILLHP